MSNQRADLFLTWMGLIDMYTLDRARKDLTQEELDFEPHPGAWGVRRRGEQRTKHAGGDDGGSGSSSATGTLPPTSSKASRW